MKYCNNCKHYKNKYCKLKQFYVSINANFCNDYKLKFLKQLKLKIWY